ncbi:hypothetical protein FEMY_23500 [Ferrovum myxofaciens]|uniref:Uncharacterized protein n=1 Tax=Ferrovum myxofaciens TaxID=416213 RepID=A0A149VV85_9PROT|nr:hypothetical protein FEMY_23500 [Ferrovum myxofaciens]
MLLFVLRIQTLLDFCHLYSSMLLGHLHDHRGLPLQQHLGLRTRHLAQK